MNVPLTASLSLSAPRPSPPSLFEVSSRAVILETLKRPENGGSAVVLRLYESWGSTAKVRISTVLNVRCPFSWLFFADKEVRSNM